MPRISMDVNRDNKCRKMVKELKDKVNEIEKRVKKIEKELNLRI